MAQITLTLPDEMREQLKKIADEEERSLNGQVRLILSKAVSGMDTEDDEEAQDAQ